MTYYRKKPVVIEAFRWTGDIDQTEDPVWIVEAIKEYKAIIVPGDPPEFHMWDDGMQRWAAAQPGWWIIKGVKGEIYPCEPSTFEMTYEPVVE